MTQQDLLNRLESDLRADLADVRARFSDLNVNALTHRPDPNSWNILECLAHLNRIADDYTPAMQRAIHRAKARRWTPSGSVRYTARGKRLLHRANPGNSKQYKSRKRYNFTLHPLGQDIVKSFIIKNEQLLRMLQAASEVDLNRTTVPKANAWFGRYTLGNLLEYLILHQRRHLRQAASIL